MWLELRRQDHDGDRALPRWQVTADKSEKDGGWKSQHHWRTSLPSPPVRAWMLIGPGEPTMQPRESVPLWVGLTFALMIVGTVMYLTGYFMIEDLLAFLK